MRSQRAFTTLRSLHLSTPTHLPRVANPSLWTSLIPKFLRRSANPSTATSPTVPHKPQAPRVRKEYTTYILLGILVGSNAIQIIGLRNEKANFSRKTDAKLEFLREVVQRVKRGEDVDVRKLLGTGEEVAEREWEEVMREVEETDVLIEGRRRRDVRREAKKVEHGEQVRARKEGKGGFTKDEGREIRWEEVMGGVEETSMLAEGREKRDVKREAQPAEQSQLMDAENGGSGGATPVREDAVAEKGRDTRPKFMM